MLAVIGHPVAHSLSPAMFNAAFAALGIEAVYVAIDVPPSALARALETFGAVGIGGNITVPHKIAAAEAVPHRTEIARDVGAINTFWTEGGELRGDNTDAGGIEDALASLHAENPWLLLGTGGSARAVAAAARARQAGIVVRSRDAARGRAFVDWAASIGVDATVDDGRTVQTVVNATPLGLHGDDAFPVSDERIRGATAALDLTYRPGGTAWVAHLAERGVRAADGRRVLVAQGVRAFRRFFPAREPPEAVMTKAVERGMKAS